MALRSSASTWVGLKHLEIQAGHGSVSHLEVHSELLALSEPRRGNLQFYLTKCNTKCNFYDGHDSKKAKVGFVLFCLFF